MLRKKVLVGITLFLALAFIAVLFFLYLDSKKIGQEVDSYKGVPVYYNGILYTKSHGTHYNSDGYYYGWKWQCVEYVRRFYHDAKGHSMPDIYGNSKDYFDKAIPQGQLNSRRGLIQFQNGGNEKPQPDDLIVFTDTKYGHVAIITEVTNDSIEVIQQNVFGKPRAKYRLKFIHGNWFVGDKRKPAGWLRVK